MSRRPAIVTQADMTRIAKSLRAAGYDRIRCTINGAAVMIEGGSETTPLAPTEKSSEPKRKVVL
jgi:hypothetical protein